MYNRYSPQPDGTYRRRTVNSSADITVPSCSIPEEHNDPPQMEQKTGMCKSADWARTSEPRKQRQYTKNKQDKRATSFLRDLLPRELDTADLLVIILLLLMSADDQGGDQGNALLTLALYLFM